MPSFLNAGHFNQRTDDSNFIKTHEPGSITPFSGIYRCVSCGFEVVSTKGHPLPPTKICPNHSASWKCDHGPVRWQLVAAAIHVSSNA
jgi:hypothetical protein